MTAAQRAVTVNNYEVIYGRALSYIFMNDLCVVLGANGFIGSHLVESLLERGMQVRVFVRNKEKTKNLKTPKKLHSIAYGDFNNRNEVEKAVKGGTYVFDFIASSTPASSYLHSEDEIKLHLLPTVRLLEICQKNNIRKVIFPSSGGSVYGNLGNKNAKENDFLNPLSPHAVTKVAIEKFLYCYWVNYKLDYVIYRISNVYGERQKFKRLQGIIPAVLTKAVKNEVLDIYGNSVRDYIYVKDVVDFIANNFDKNHQNKIYNIGSGVGVSIKELLNIIEEETRLKLKVRLKERRPIDVERIVLDIERISKEFSFKPSVDLREGVRKFINAQTFR
ncbi:hypothetical protein A3A74_05455 [Candidatus Roizmanbacteria bacterium RIFCSPLOWO2_01_FULL_35_13]|uniref:NAD-dependent epimerase/dehydratase domain-containing protein n=1 Tax=Candidatus Roizmanbacteria bacterium RIFCSPLOWO2_01_FULL_35_13 TaxID=1802055 RepID=A0A1F7I960_9BACT|nr:MAG: hypothetical protein A3A74_05455 [Candidatus Roizmanbacteria bacterium RIFCSPLOWO2_01_FULL_35_13]